ncbi:MAG: ABC transporter permease, partial [Gemmatimonadaceae bacterium]
DSDPNSTHDRKQRAFRIESGAARVERDVDEEMEFHLAMRAQKFMRLGLAPTAAREQALQQFGDLPAVRDECLTIDTEHHRAMTRVNRLNDLKQDVAYAFRSLRHNKSFAIVTILILALGIGANTAIFSLVNVLLLRKLPVPNANELVLIGSPMRANSMSDGSPRTDMFSYDLYKDMRDGSHTVSGLYATGRTGGLDVVRPHFNDPTARIVDSLSTSIDHPNARFVSNNYFSVLQVLPSAGRTFAASEGLNVGDAPVVVVSYNYWQRQLAADTRAVGSTLSVNGTALTIIGVAAQGFNGDIVDRDVTLFIPLTMQPVIVKSANWLDNHRDINWLNVMGRMKPGISLPQARAELVTVTTRAIIDHALPRQIISLKQDIAEKPVVVQSGAQGYSFYRTQYSTALVTLMVAVVLVLLVVCANVANLLLARATARTREMSLRMALGASRVRLIQQLLTESLIIALAGGVLGILVAAWASQALLYIVIGNRSSTALNTSLDIQVLFFSALVSIVAAALFGLMPALSATRVELAGALRSSGRNVAGNGGKFGVGRLLVVAQVAMSVLLLVGTGMLVRSMNRLEGSDVGAARDQLLITSIDAAHIGYKGARLATLLDAITESVRHAPGVTNASASLNGIFSGTESGTNFQAEGFVARASADTNASYDDVGADYFHTIGARISKGRDFTAIDNETGLKVAILNESLAKFLYPNGDALGKHITVDSASREIVGVVADVNEGSLRGEPARRFYVPLAQHGERPGTFYVEIKTSGDPSKTVNNVRKAILAVDALLPLRHIDPLNLLIRESIGQDRLVAQVVTLFGALALVLSALGLYGVMAYATLRRTSEFGLRLALGAVPGAIVGLVLREALVTTAAGLLIGLPFAFGMSQLLREQLFGIGTVDVPSIVLAVTVLAVTAALAAYLPAMRASRVAPLDALRAD